MRQLLILGYVTLKVEILPLTQSSYQVSFPLSYFFPLGIIIIIAERHFVPVCYLKS